VGLVIDPPDKVAALETLRLALPEGLEVVTFTVPKLKLELHVTCICGSGVPLLELVIVPPVTVHDIVVLVVQFPAIV
jgi:hypothetical protein